GCPRSTNGKWRRVEWREASTPGATNGKIASATAVKPRWAERRRLVFFQAHAPGSLALRTWPETFGSGPRTSTRGAPTGCSGAAAGTSTAPAAGGRPGTGARPRPGSGGWECGWPGIRPAAGEQPAKRGQKRKGDAGTQRT